MNSDRALLVSVSISISVSVVSVSSVSFSVVSVSAWVLLPSNDLRGAVVPAQIKVMDGQWRVWRRMQ